MSRKEFLKKKVLEHLIGPTGSILLHILIIYLAIHYIVFDVREGTEEVEVTLMEMDVVDLDDLLDDIEPELEPLDFDLDFEMPDMDVDMDVPPDMEDFAQDTPDMDFTALDVQAVDSPLTMQGLFAGRNADGRAELLRRYGGRWGELTEQAVVRALEWLRENQNEDGSWSAEIGGEGGQRMRVGVTGLSLLAFLAHGETLASERYGHTVRRAIRFLVDNQSDEGHFIDTDDGNVRYKTGTYGNAIATYAIAEAYALTRLPTLRPAMEKGVESILEGQNPRGLWFYSYEDTDVVNTSVSVWQMQALKAAELAGARNEGLQEGVERGLERLLARQAEDGEFFYIQERIQSARRPDHGVTAAAVLTLQLFGEGGSAEARRGAQVLRDARIDWERPNSWFMSRWYYVTQVKFQQGGGTWDSWNNQFAPVFINNQNRDGSWTSPARSGANIPFGFEHFFGPAFSTAMSALTLQVYYRILPTFAVVEDPEPEDDDVDDVIIQII